MRARDYSLPDGLGLTPACVALLRRLLEPDENARIRMEEIMQARHMGREGRQQHGKGAGGGRWERGIGESDASAKIQVVHQNRQKLHSNIIVR